MKLQEAHFQAIEEKNKKQDEGKLKHNIERDYRQLGMFPYSDEIEQSEPAIKFNAPKCLDCKRTKNLVPYVVHFKTNMATVSLSWDKGDTMMCKLFTTTLCDGEKKWYNNLAHCTITSFSQFTKMLITNYASNKPMRKESHHLFSITQGSDKSVEDCMKRFIEEKLNIIDCPSSLEIKAFRRGLLKSSNLFVELMKNVP